METDASGSRSSRDPIGAKGSGGRGGGRRACSRESLATPRHTGAERRPINCGSDLTPRIHSQIVSPGPFYHVSTRTNVLTKQQRLQLLLPILLSEKSQTRNKTLHHKNNNDKIENVWNPCDLIQALAWVGRSTCKMTAYSSSSRNHNLRPELPSQLEQTT